MKRSAPISAQATSTIAMLAEPRRMNSLTPIGARAVYSLRLIAVHQRARRDPMPELCVRLGSVETGSRMLALSQAVTSCWPENVHVGRFCCDMLSHDEATIGAMIDHAARCQRAEFEASVQGLIRPDRIHRLWDACLAYIAAEARAH